ncbi:MAG TPA: hypothetical protein VIR63_01990 [Pontiella sp.]
MTPFKIIRKIGKMLRGGAGKKEILLGAICGVLIGFNPTSGLTLALMILITLLLNANVGFTLLGAALGKALALILAPISFHTGFFIIHQIGLESLFTTLANTPVTALMDLNVYAMIGSLPYAVISGIIFANLMAAAITKIREQMVKAGENEKVSRVASNKLAKLMIWVVFGKQKVSTADVLAKQSPLLRKSGLILVGSVAVIFLVLQVSLLDLALKKGLQTAISLETGAEVNIEKANLSLVGGKLELEGLQITDPDKPSHNLIQIDQLAADVSVRDLLRKSYAIDLLSGSTLQRDVLRSNPGKLLPRKDKLIHEKDEAIEEAQADKQLEEYFSKAKDWKKYGTKLREYLGEREKGAEAAEKGETAPASKEEAVADAKKLGYLKVAADLTSSRPRWTIRKIKINKVELGGNFPAQTLEGTELSSHPELNGLPTSLTLTPEGEIEPTAKLVMRFDDSTAQHELEANLKNIEISDVKTGEHLNIESGKADLSINGKFSADSLNAPFTVTIRNLKTDNETLNSLKEIKLPGKLYGTLSSPRVKVEIGDNLKSAVVGAAKEKAKEEAKKAAQKEVDKVLESDETQELKSKAKDALKKFSF